MSQVTEQSVRFQTALASIKLIQASAVLDLTEDDFEIGRAVQQECRDRSRMPSSASHTAIYNLSLHDALPIYGRDSLVDILKERGLLSESDAVQPLIGKKS